MISLQHKWMSSSRAYGLKEMVVDWASGQWFTVNQLTSYSGRTLFWSPVVGVVRCRGVGNEC